MNNIHLCAQKTAAALTAFALVKNQKWAYRSVIGLFLWGGDVCVVPFQCVGQGFFGAF